MSVFPFSRTNADSVVKISDQWTNIKMTFSRGEIHDVVFASSNKICGHFQWFSTQKFAIFSRQQRVYGRFTNLHIYVKLFILQTTLYIQYSYQHQWLYGKYATNKQNTITSCHRQIYASDAYQQQSVGNRIFAYKRRLLYRIFCRIMTISDLQSSINILDNDPNSAFVGQFHKY